MAKQRVSRRPRNLSNVETQYLLLELSNRKKTGKRNRKMFKNLSKQRKQLLSRLKKIDNRLQKVGGGNVRHGSTGPQRRAKNSMTLLEAIQRTVGTKTLSVTSIAAAVQKRGYKTHAANFRTVVNQVLIKHTKIFKRTGRGMYTTRTKKAPATGQNKAAGRDNGPLGL